MERSIIYDLLENVYLREWKDEADKNEKCGFKHSEQVAGEKLADELNEKDKSLLTAYALAIKNRMDYIYYNITIRVLNFGIKIGMELQGAFINDEQ